MKQLDYNPTQKINSDDEEVIAAPQMLPFVKRSFGVHQVNFSLDEPIVEPKYYRAVLSELQTLGQHDSVNITIASGGGNASGMIMIIEAIRNTEATVSGAIIGDCHSAASIIAMNCDQLYVAPYASMMVHNISYGYSGKDADVLGMVTHTSEWSKTLLRDTYEGFLTEKELQEVINNKEYWFTSDEIKERLTKREAFRQKQLKKALKVSTLVPLAQ